MVIYNLILYNNINYDNFSNGIWIMATQTALLYFCTVRFSNMGEESKYDDFGNPLGFSLVLICFFEKIIVEHKNLPWIYDVHWTNYMSLSLFGG